MKLNKTLHHPILWLTAVLLGLTLLALAGAVPMSRITQVAIYTLYAGGVSLLVAYAGLVPFGASVFFGCASYAAALSTLHWFGSDLAGMIFAPVFSMLLAALLGALILRRRGLYFSLLTLACSQIAFEIAYKWTSFTGGENGLQNIARPTLASDSSFHVFVLTSVVGCMWLLWRLVHSPFGRGLQAIRDNEQRAASVGYDTYQYKLVAFVLAGGFIGWAGALQTYLLRGVYANSLSWQHAADALLMTVLGGAHHFLGSLWGAIAFILLEDQLSAVTENWWLIFAPIIIGFVLLAPNGLHGLLQWGRKPHRTLVRDSIPPRPQVIRPLEHAAIQVPPGEPILRVRGLNKRFGALLIAKGLDLDVHAHRLHSFIGPNGAGKTTFFHMLSGVLSPDSGQVTFLGKDITHLPLHERVRLGLCRSFQIVSVFPNLSAFENVRVAVQAQQQKGWGFWRDAQLLANVNDKTWSLIDSVGLADDAAVCCEELSHGKKRLLEIAITIATNAKLLLLDEPLAGLAQADRAIVSTLIQKLARTHAVLLIEHDIDRVLSLSDRITVLHQGRLIADGKPSEVASNPDVIAAYLGSSRQAVRSTAVTRSPVTSVHPTREHGGTPVLLKTTGICSGYNGGRILDEVDFTVGVGEVVALLGRNGVGKTTLLKTIMGTVPLTQGSIFFAGQSLSGLAPYEVNRRGIAIVPEGRRLFLNLSVLDNLRVATRPGGAALDEVFSLFPKLGDVRLRKAEFLSGGERQMVAIARAMMAPSSLILLDEPFEGLAPTVVQEVMDAIVRLSSRTSLVLVEHHAEQVLSIADRAYVLVNGAVAYEGTAAALDQDLALQASLLGVVQPSLVDELVEHTG